MKQSNGRIIIKRDCGKTRGGQQVNKIVLANLRLYKVPLEIKIVPDKGINHYELN